MDQTWKVNLIFLYFRVVKMERELSPYEYTFYFRKQRISI